MMILVYTVLMRRIQLYIDDDLDDALSAEAARLGTSRSAVVRDTMRRSLSTSVDSLRDAVDEMIGWIDVEPDDDIDSVIYEPGS